MEESSPKRRRLSPRLSASSQPVGDRAIEDSATTNIPRRKRPSFASPTRASLSRHNPSILERRSSSPTKTRPSLSSRPRRRSSTPHGGVSAVNFGRLSVPLENVASEDPPASDVEREPSVPAPETEGGLNPSRQSEPRSASTGLRGPPRRSPIKPIPRPLPRGSDGEDDLSQLFSSHSARRFANLGIGTPTEPEPELPPVAHDAVSSTPPRGIHSSPLRWKEKKKPKKSSPLKAPPQRSRFLPDDGRAHTSRLRVGEDFQVDVSLDPSTSYARKVPALDPDSDKKRRRDELLGQISALEKDLEIVKRESERIRVMHATGRQLPGNDEDAVLDVVRRCLAPKAEASPTQLQQMVQAALNPATYFAFGKRVSPPAVVDEVELASKIKSHHPVQLSIDEELPYLQLFTPFVSSSTMSMLAEEADQPTRQRHEITLRSHQFPGTFNAKIVMVVNAADLSILDLSVPIIPRSAVSELQPFITKICKGECNRSMERNVGVLAWALSEWHRVSLERAAFWMQLEKAVGTKAALLSTAETLRAKNIEQRRRRDEDDEQHEDEPTLCSRTDLLYYAGRQFFDVEIPIADAASLRFEWKIGFDWTGEAQSNLGVMLGVPGKWHAVDRRGFLGQLPKLFSQLVDNSEEPREAVNTIVALVVGEKP